MKRRPSGLSRLRPKGFLSLRELALPGIGLLICEIVACLLVREKPVVCLLMAAFWCDWRNLMQLSYSFLFVKRRLHQVTYAKAAADSCYFRASIIDYMYLIVNREVHPACKESWSMQWYTHTYVLRGIPFGGAARPAMSARSWVIKKS